MITTTMKISEDISEKINKAAELIGVKKQELIDRAILLYLDNISKYLDIKKEIKDWDALSDEALINFEKAL